MQQSVSVPFGGSATLLNQGLQAGAIVYNIFQSIVGNR